MAKIRQVAIERFRGFDAFVTTLRDHVILVGEPGAGRSDLLEAIARVLDPDSLRQRRASDLDFYDLDTNQDAIVELTITSLSTAMSTALTKYLEVWDFEDEVLVTRLPSTQRFDPGRHEFAVRLGYRLFTDAGQLREIIYWPKFADRGAGTFPLARRVEREQIPFLFQRGLGTRPLDLAPQGEFRNVVDKQAAATGFPAAVAAFLAAVEAGASTFAADPAVSSALEEVLRDVRQARRLDPVRRATDILAFLPDGGSEAGLLRSLAAVATIDGAPAKLSMGRHGASLGAAVRGGLLAASAQRVAGSIIVVEDLGGEIDPHLARHLAARIRSGCGQLVASSRSPSVIEAFAPEEVLRLHASGGRRIASAGTRPRTKPQRLAARYYSRYLVPALHASTVLIVEGHTDRLGFGSLADRARDGGLLGSFDAAGIAIVEAGSNGQAPKLAEAARSLGLFTVVLLDNEAGSAPDADPTLQAALAAADTVLRLPARTSLERVLLDGVPDAELIRIFEEIDTAVGGLGLPPGWATKTGNDLVAGLAKVMHDRTGSIHAIFVEALDATALSPLGLRALSEVYRIANNRGPSGLVAL